MAFPPKKKSSKAPTGKSNPKKPFGKDLKITKPAPEIPKSEMGAKNAGPTQKQADMLHKKGVKAATRKKRNIGRS